MSQYTVNMTYEPYAKEPEYIEANRAFLAGIDLTATRSLLDLACGIGTMTDLILEKKKELAVWGLDLSMESLLIGREHFLEEKIFQRSGPKSIVLLQGSADCLPIRDESVETVIMGNAIHLLPSEDALVKEIHRVLKPGGLFAFNSSFYAGTMPEGTEAVHHEWVKEAVKYIMQKDVRMRKQGLKGIPRKRGTVPGAFSHAWPSSENWTQTLQSNGFHVKSIHERIVNMTQRNFETIGAYGGFAKVILSGYPVEEASEALQATAGTAFSGLNLETVPRLWLEVVTEKAR